MTLIIQSGKVKNTESTEIRIGKARVSAGGLFSNSGKVKVFEDGDLSADKDFLNSGELTINDPEKIKQIITESLKTAKTVAELGTEVLRKTGLTQ